MAQPNHSNDVPLPLTIRQRLWVFPIIARLPLAIAIGVFRENKGRSWAHAANVAATRYMFSRGWDMQTLHSFIGVTTAQVYQTWTLKEKQEVVTDFLPEGAKLHWIGPRRDSSQNRIFLYFHGGGFSLPARPEYFSFLHALQKDVSASLGDVGVALLEYSLIPDCPFPTQLRQANAALIHLLNKGIHPTNIIIGGDSAGGSLVLQLASHIMHPLPSIPAPPTLAQPLAGALLVSPWCSSYSVDAPSFSRNDRKDVIPKRTYAFFTSLVIAGLTPELERHCQPLSAPAGWYNGLDSIFARILITTGEHECPFDHIIETSAMISQYVRDTVTVVEPGGVHEEMIIKFAVGEGGSGKGYDAIIAFLSRSFQGGS